MENEVADEGGFWARRRCDSCKRAPAMLFCPADAAYLCGACDARVHGGEHQAAGSRHRRVWVCEVCQQAPAAVTCKADAATLCVTCDADIHSANTLASRHERARLVPFLEPFKPPAAVSAFLLGDDGNKVELAAPWLIPNTGHAHPKGSTGAAKLQSADYFFSEMDPFRDLDNASSIDARFHQTDSVVPVHTKVKGGEDGGSLPPPPRPPPPPFLPVDAGLELDCAPPRPSYSSYTTHSISHSVSSSEAGVVPDWSSGGGGGSTAEVTNSYGGVAVSRADREARVMRYREKRKSRRFEKTIRYASRKAYAETRPRIRGRFVKREEIEAEIDPIYSPSSSVAALMVNAGYGVVPSF